MGFYLYIYMHTCVGANAVYLSKHGCLTVFSKLLEGVAKRNYVILKLVHAYANSCVLYFQSYAVEHSCILEDLKTG